jgi:hypothetical protein
MNIAEKYSLLLDALNSKLAGEQDVTPYAQELLDGFIRYNLAWNLFAVTVSVIILAICITFVIKGTKQYTKRGDDASVWAFGGVLWGLVAGTIVLIPFTVSVARLLEVILAPDMLILDEIWKWLETVRG